MSQTLDVFAGGFRVMCYAAARTIGKDPAAMKPGDVLVAPYRGHTMWELAFVVRQDERNKFADAIRLPEEVKPPVESDGMGWGDLR